MKSTTPAKTVPLLFLAMIALVSNTAIAGEIPRCTFSNDVHATRLMRDIPKAILADFSSHVADIAAPDEPFNATDVIIHDLPMRRLIQAIHRGPRWIIAYERGGFAYSDHVVVYQLSKPDGKATLLANKSAVPESLCTSMIYWLDHDPAPTDGIDKRW